jgi:subtilisin family serine protease
MSRRHFMPTRRSAPRRLTVAVLVPLTVLAVGLSTAGASLASSAPRHPGATRLAGAFVPGQLLVRFTAGTSPLSAAAVNAAIGSRTAKSFTDLVPNLQLVQLRPGLSVSAALRYYAQRSNVLYAQPNWVSHIYDAKTKPDSITKTPNDPQYPGQWDWPKIGAPSAWDTTTGSHTIVVTDIDTGMDYNHDDLAANAWKNTAECNGTPGVDDDGNGYVDDCHGIDTINGDSDPIDDNGHGTHTAGTIGAVGNNGVGVTGLNWKVQVMPCKSHNSVGNGSVASIIGCYQYVRMEKVRYGYDIVATNNSYGSCPEACDFNPATYDAIAALIKPGVIMSFAAGNAFRDNDVRPNYPSNYDLPNIIAVAATDSGDNLAGFSEWGLRSVDVGAPGVGVLSTYINNGYASLSGTSMAAPHVAGLVALLHSFDAQLDWWAIRNLIIAGGDPVTSLQGKTVSGRRINANGSMTCSGQKVFGMLAPVATTGTMTQTVEALNIKCANPAGPVTVTITPGGTTLSLTDDGKGADKVAGDGIYSVFWRPACGAGPLTFTFSNGKSYPVNVTACITADPRSGPPGTMVTVTGSGYSASEIVDVFFDGDMVRTVNANAQGQVNATFNVPASASSGQHDVTASGQTSGLAAVARFRVT